MNKRVIVIGAGHWGKNLVKTFYELGALAGVAEASSILRDELSRSYPNILLYQDYKECLNESVDAFVIATPAHTHYQIAYEALESGKDVFVEKPITLSTDEAEKLHNFAESHGRILMVGHLLLYQPVIQEMKRLLESGFIGELKSIHQERLKLGRVRSVENVLWSFGVHDIAVFLYLVGSEPKRSIVNGDRIIQPAIEDDVYLHLDFLNGVTAHLHTSWLWPEQRRRLVVVATEGMMVYDEEQQTLVLHRKGIHRDLSNRDDGHEVIFKGNEQPLKLECMHFLQCVEKRTRPISDGKNGLEVVRILENASIKLGSGTTNG
ncbi:Gfo/Idh/MocA family protein [Paenibacillus thermotolerans]|uniref:Gfo/Idh/MocA family protein n=1 Tax=Paenibacillus thermotolerans TaxID=3027807 RepID=UPI002368C47A|nr:MULTISPECIES: Gfo/Idh/MocA family oxidoreductase [unclassified Paenibacillus]